MGPQPDLTITVHVQIPVERNMVRRLYQQRNYRAMAADAPAGHANHCASPRRAGGSGASHDGCWRTSEVDGTRPQSRTVEDQAPRASRKASRLLPGGPGAVRCRLGGSGSTELPRVEVRPGAGLEHYRGDRKSVV